MPPSWRRRHGLTLALLCGLVALIAVLPAENLRGGSAPLGQGSQAAIASDRLASGTRRANTDPTSTDPRTPDRVRGVGSYAYRAAQAALRAFHVDIPPTPARWGVGGRTLSFQTREPGATYLLASPRASLSLTYRGWASAFGPGLYGRRTYCGQRLTTTSLGIAHRRWRCGQRVVVCYHRRCAHVRVIDRGPFVARRAIDLTEGTTRRYWRLDARHWGTRYVTYRKDA